MKGLEGVTARGVACGWRHSMVVDDCGKLYSCGWSKYGQLGHGDFDTLTVMAQVMGLQDETVRASHMLQCQLRPGATRRRMCVCPCSPSSETYLYT